MRKRSNTIIADSYQEFLDLSISQSPAAYDSSSYLESPYCYLPSNSDSYQEPLTFSVSSDPAFPHIDKPFVLSPDRKDKPEQDGDLYFSVSSTIEDESTSISTEADSWFSSNTSSLSRLESSGLKAKTKAQSEETGNGELHKVMLIGSTGTGRHTVINSLFEDSLEQKPGEPKLRNAMDLLIRSKKDHGQTRRFKFWIRDPNCQRFDPLVRVYYRSINYYIFLYKSTDIKSLECAEKAIQEVVAEVPKNRFKGLLLANNQGISGERQVSKQVGEKVREKYGLEMFVEVEDLKGDAGKIDQELKQLLGLAGCQ